MPKEQANSNASEGENQSQQQTIAQTNPAFQQVVQNGARPSTTNNPTERINNNRPLNLVIKEMSDDK